MLYEGLAHLRKRQLDEFERFGITAVRIDPRHRRDLLHALEPLMPIVFPLRSAPW